MLNPPGKKILQPPLHDDTKKIYQKKKRKKEGWGRLSRNSKTQVQNTGSTVSILGFFKSSLLDKQNFAICYFMYLYIKLPRIFIYFFFFFCSNKNKVIRTISDNLSGFCQKSTSKQHGSNSINLVGETLDSK